MNSARDEMKRHWRGIPERGWQNGSGVNDTLINRAAGGVVKSNGTFADSGVSNAGAIASSPTLAVPASGVAVGTIRCQPAAPSPASSCLSAVLTASTSPVFDESSAANTITFASGGTINVADGTSSVVAGLTARTFVWNAATSLWYPAK
jgi:hypothetical protein